MRSFILFILLFVSSFGFSQNNNQEPSKNENAISLPLEEKEMDTLQLKDIETKSSSKKSKSETKEKSQAYDNDLNAPSKAENFNSAASTSSFSISKSQASTQRTQRSPTISQQQQMNSVVQNLEENSPESFEYHYFKYVAGNYNVELIDELKKAETLRPTNSDVQIQMAGYYMIMRDSKNSLIYLQKLVASTRLNKDVIDYAEDLLKSVPENGTLITHGFDDTYAAAYIQMSQKIRSDVRLISLDFLQSEKYKENLKSEGFSLPARTIVDIQYFQDFCVKNALKSLGISMTTPKEYLSVIQQNLFVVGLVFEYHSDITFNNFYKNDYLWNEILTKKIVENATNDKAKQLSANYLPMLLHLRKVYDQTNEKVKVNEIDVAIDKVAVQCKKYDQVQKLKSSY